MTFKNGDFYMSCNTTIENMYNKYKELEKEIDSGKYANFKEKQVYLSNIIKNDPSIITKQTFSGGRLEKYRSQINFPVLSGYGTYSEDISLLDISNIHFVGLEDGKTSTKGMDFIGTNCSGTIFENITFMIAAFICTNFEKTKFINCKFIECVFKGSSIKNCDFEGCQYDANTAKYM